MFLNACRILLLIWHFPACRRFRSTCPGTNALLVQQLFSHSWIHQSYQVITIPWLFIYPVLRVAALPCYTVLNAKKLCLVSIPFICVCRAVHTLNTAKEVCMSVCVWGVVGWTWVRVVVVVVWGSLALSPCWVGPSDNSQDNGAPFWGLS